MANDKVIKKYKSIRVQTKLKPMNGKMVRIKYSITKEYNITTIIQLLDTFSIEKLARQYITILLQFVLPTIIVQFKNNHQILGSCALILWLFLWMRENFPISVCMNLSFHTASTQPQNSIQHIMYTFTETKIKPLECRDDFFFKTFAVKNELNWMDSNFLCYWVVVYLWLQVK